MPKGQAQQQSHATTTSKANMQQHMCMAYNLCWLAHFAVVGKAW